MSTIEAFELTGVKAGEQTCLAAIRQSNSTDRPVSLFFSAGDDLDIIQPGSDTTEIDRRSIGGAPVLTWNLPDMGPVQVSVGRKMTEIPTQTANHDVLAGLNVGLAIRNLETAKTTADWLAFHSTYHGMNGALIVNRNRSENFAENLAPLIAGLNIQRIIILTPDFPLGRTDLPSEAHPFNAPDAPGKDRMAVPKPAPWYSPLAELSIYQLLQKLYLARARAIANFDICDIVMPADTGVFDQAVNSPNGVVTLAGRHCYPWRLRPREPASFGDHICVQFDVTTGPNRWCVAPGRTGQNTIWRIARIVGPATNRENIHPFMRFMALKHGQEFANKLVPKSSLVENQQLLDLAETTFRHKPVRAPQVELPKVKPNSCKTAIVTTMKNEGPFILEWLAYHRVIGVEDFLIYTNDCTDGTDTFLSLLQENGFVQHRLNDFRETGLKPQHSALQAAKSEPTISRADWVICMDVDEYLNIKTGNGTLTDLYMVMGDANMISCTWRLFGNADIHEFKDAPVIQQFDQCAPELSRKPHQAWGFKTLFRNIGIFKKLGVHRPKGLNPQHWGQINWVNGSGAPLPPQMYRNAWRSTKDTYGYDIVSLNHYAVRSAESFLVKRDRGRVNHVDRDQGLSYWFRMNNNTENEISIQRMLPRLKAEMDRMLSNPDIAAAHENCVAQHRKKIAELKQTENYASFFETLTGERMQRLSRLHHLFGANVFLAGPDCIPDEVINTDHAAGYFFSVEKQEASH